MPSRVTRVSPQILLRVIILAVLVLGAFAPTAASATSARVVATESVNVRACADTTCEVVGSLRLGDAATIAGDIQNGFYPIVWGSSTGYVYALYLAPNGAVLPLIEGDQSCARVAFIFNIGIGYPPSQSVIDTLVANDIPATMFPMGSFARNQPAYLKQLDDAGFEIGTHGDQNLYLTQQPDDVVRTDVSNSRTAIEAVIERPIDPYFTAYAADTDGRVRTLVGDMGLLPIEWRVPAADYADWATEADVYSRVVDGVYPGAIVEFHLDGPATDTSTAAALPGIIQTLSSRGYEFVDIGGMAAPCQIAERRGSGQSQPVATVSDRRKHLASATI